MVDELGSSDKCGGTLPRESQAPWFLRKVAFDYMKAHADEVEAVIHMGAISATTETDADLIIRTNSHAELAFVGVLFPVRQTVYLRFLRGHLRGRFLGV